MRIRPVDAAGGTGLGGVRAGGVARVQRVVAAGLHIGLARNATTLRSIAAIRTTYQLVVRPRSVANNGVLAVTRGKGPRRTRNSDASARVSRDGPRRVTKWKAWIRARARLVALQHWISFRAAKEHDRRQHRGI